MLVGTVGHRPMKWLTRKAPWLHHRWQRESDFAQKILSYLIAMSGLVLFLVGVFAPPDG
jgi:hypothetical protein